MKYTFQFFTIVILFLSFMFDRKKTTKALSLALKRFIAILPTFIIVILLTSVVIGFVSPKSIQTILGSSSNRWLGSAIASVIGSVAIMPGFVAFPLAGILRNNGVPYMVISGFTTTLMMVGIITFPIEKEFLGTSVAIIRNVISLLIALAVIIFTGIVFGEVF